MKCKTLITNDHISLKEFPETKHNQYHFLMIGLNSTGKRSIIKKALNKTIPIIPTIEFSIEMERSEEMIITSLTVQPNMSAPSLRESWKPYYRNKEGIIFVSNSVDTDIEYYKYELDYLLHDDFLQGVSVIVLANKRDLNEALSIKQIADGLELNQIKGRQWNIIGTSAITGQGIKEGIDWLMENTQSNG